MSEGNASLWVVLLLALLPGAGNFAGGLVAEFMTPSSRWLNWALHAATGIVIAIVALELMPEALSGLSGVWIGLAFAGGGIIYLLIEGLLERWTARGKGQLRMWMIYVAVATDLTSDGLMIGTSSAVSISLALVLAGGQVLADVPEGYAAISNMKDKQVPRARRLWLSASFMLFSIGAAAIAYLLLRSAPEPAKLSVLAMVAGLLTVAAIEDMLDEAHDAQEDTRRSVLAFIGGFALFALVSGGLERLVAGGG